MSLRRDNELLSDEGPDSQDRLIMALVAAGGLGGLFAGDLPGMLFGAGVGYGLALTLISLLTWLSRFFRR